VELPGYERLKGGARAAIWHERRFQTKLGVEQQARYVGYSTNASVAVGQFLRIGLQVIDEFLETGSLGRFLGDDCLRRKVGDADLGEAPCRIVFQVGVERRCRRLSSGVADRDGVAVG